MKCLVSLQRWNIVWNQMLFFSADSFYQETFFRDFRVDLKHTGHIIWKFGGTFSTSCSLDMTYYPFDTQICSIDIENWSYTSDAVDLYNMTADVHLQEFSSHGEYSLGHTVAEKSYFTEDLYPGKLFPRVKFIMHLRRKPEYYTFNIILPCIFCMIIALMAFWLPPESGEKISIGISVLLAFSVFQLVVVNHTPKTSDYTPVLSE